MMQFFMIHDDVKNREMLPTLLAHCEGSPVDSPHKGSVTEAMTLYFPSQQWIHVWPYKVVGSMWSPPPPPPPPPPRSRSTGPFLESLNLRQSRSVTNSLIFILYLCQIDNDTLLPISNKCEWGIISWHGTDFSVESCDLFTHIV